MLLILQADLDKVDLITTSLPRARHGVTTISEYSAYRLSMDPVRLVLIRPPKLKPPGTRPAERTTSRLDAIAAGCAAAPAAVDRGALLQRGGRSRRISPAHDVAAKDTVGTDYGSILVNDGSSDRTWEIMRELAARDPQLVAVNLSRRHGHQRAMTAGLHSCRGNRVLTIDSDLQDPPELLGEMWRLMDRVEADVVYGQRRERQGETMLKRGTAALFYRILQRLADSDMPVDTGDFRLMSRKVGDILNSMPEQQRFIRGMVSWIGLRQNWRSPMIARRALPAPAIIRSAACSVSPSMR